MKGRSRARVTGAGTKFRLLMWKNFLQQWRRRVQTFVEVLLPVLTLALVLILRSQIEPTVESVMTYPSLPAWTLNYSLNVLGGMDFGQLSVAYSPESPVLEKVMRRATAKLITRNLRDLTRFILDQYPDYADMIPPDLELPDLSELPINGTLITEIIERIVGLRVYAYNSSESLRGLYTSENVTRHVIAGVEFDDELTGATQLGSNLRYSLRFPERPRQYAFYSQGSRSWQTDLTFPSFQVPGPRNPYSWEGGNAPGYVNEMFIALQHMISMELVAEVTGQDFSNFSVAIRRYPHPPYVLDLAVEALQFLMPMFIMISFSYTAINIVRAVTVEKELQLKETMKIMGLPTWLHWTAWFCKQFIYLLIIAILVVILVKVNWFTNEAGFSDYAVLTNTPWTVLFFFLLLYFACTIFFCFMISGFFSKASTAALFSGVIWFITYLPAFMLLMDVQVSSAVQAVFCLSINTAMAFGFQLILAKESAGGMQWGQFWEVTDLDSNRFEFGTVVVMLVIDCVLYMLIALYLEQVLPGPHAAPKPWYFMFQKSFWLPNRKITAVDITNGSNDGIVMEKVADDYPIGVKMTNLTKVYAKNVAVNNLCLDIYDGQITVLLGHNGAGKSTTISMLTGNTEVTSGSVWMAGYDISQQTAAARANLGFCPQHNVLFNELTVREHLEFFARLKGFTGQDLQDDIDTLITKLELDDKRDYQSAGLSGGQKRRLSVGIALSGAPRVVLLDEPTSGMDPASRRALWDLLQKEKAGRSMILTTHFMDEADILGDRVAIMSSGRLQCVGSPYFLKKHYGVGYTLVVVKRKGFQLESCTEIIGRHIPGIAIKEDRGTEVTYGLTNDQSHLFEAMLNDLEANIDTVKFKNYGLTATTLEDVFMSVGSDVGPTAFDDVETNTSGGTDDMIADMDILSMDQMDKEQDMLSGFRLFVQHVLAVWYKLWLVWSRSWMLLLMQVLVPLLMINITLGILQWVMSVQPKVIPRALTLGQGFVETETVLSYNGTSENSIGALAKVAYEHMFNSSNVETMKITVVENQAVDDYYLYRTNEASQMAFLRGRMLTGVTFDEDSATAWFSNFGFHDVAISLSAVHQALLKAWHPNATLSVFNYPLEVNYMDQSNMQSYVAYLSTQLSSGIASSFGIVSAVYVMFYIKERILRAKLLQKAAGIQPIVMWASAAVVDWAWYCVISVTIVISCVAFQVIGLSTATELGRMYLALMVYGASMLPLHYLLSFLFKGPATGFVAVFFINVLFGQMGAQIVEALLSPALGTEDVAQILDSILQLFPLYSLVRSITFLSHIGLTEWSCLQACDYLSAVLPVGECTVQTMCDRNFTACCVRDDPFFEWEEPGILRYLTCMLVSGAVFWIVLLVIEYDVYHKIFNWTKTPPPLDESSIDPDVVAEMKHVEQISKANLAQQSLVAKGLSKYYGKHLAVNQVSFTVADGEVFGLLGVNGAGKTTTFKMLMGDEIISSGDAFVSGYSVKTDINSVHENIGYCPQFDAVFGELTGRETLRLFTMLRGLPTQYASMRADLLADSLGFTKHLDKRVEQYSGGNKRKLSTAIALLGFTRLVFVDEPTTGVDPAAKRQVWRAIRGARRAGRGVVLTSHSMEECEALCSRLTIMVNGNFQCLGTPQHLKNKFSEGFTLTIKMKIDEESADSIAGARGIAAVKRYVENNFTTPKLMEEYQGLLTYYLPDRSVAWSRMFGTMERCRQDHDVEDYTISQTTLEQIFLQFTKYQREMSERL
ncbi:phospholipid-transporting ATPase ABCA3-like [Leguminivora glycinivorella]|uniref:phospholipid-transporting ATPase ABCA3-like n=1 Tax=Leguminivora glycinivorella TaxID=1035111 RepID=UPI00200E5954|nr:phospholipid-transporting ATPase ABCA3-like [Leguminivora glycinivorella]